CTVLQGFFTGRIIRYSATKRTELDRRWVRRQETTMGVQGLLHLAIISTRLYRKRTLAPIKLNNFIHVGWKDHQDTRTNSRPSLIATPTPGSDGNNPPSFGQLPRKTSRFTYIVFVTWVDYN